MIAVSSPMEAELRALLPLLDGAQTVSIAGRTFHHGQVHGRPVVLVLSGIGKVAAATTATLLLTEFGATQIVFTGTAGGLGAGVNVGDVVLGSELLQHDLDASPLFPRFEVPMTGRSRFPTDAALGAALATAARRCLADVDAVIGPAHRADFGIAAPRLHEGLMVSGDRFVSTARESAALRQALPGVLAVEMEGAAVAQVALDFGARVAVLRCISDRADDAAHVDFGRFIAEVASLYTRAIISDWLAQA